MREISIKKFRCYISANASRRGAKINVNYVNGKGIASQMMYARFGTLKCKHVLGILKNSNGAVLAQYVEALKGII